MPKTKFENFIFTVIMVFIMVYAMICYNIALNIGGLQDKVFLMAFGELRIMWPVAIIPELFVIERPVMFLTNRVVTRDMPLIRILLDLKEHTGKTHPGHAVTQFVAVVPGIGQRERRKKLSCRPLFEICCLLYAEQHYVTDEVRKNQMEKLKTFVDDRLFRHPEAFQESQIISTAFDFLRKMVDGCC